MRSFLELFYNTVISLIRITIGFPKKSVRFVYRGGTDNTIRVLANGSSLSEHIENFDYNDGYDYFVVNLFALSPYFNTIRPSKYILADDLFWMDDDYSGAFEKRNKLYEMLLTVSWRMELFVPLRGYKRGTIQSFLKTNENIKVIPYYANLFNGFKSIKYWLYKHDYATPLNQNVIIPELFISINYGYRKIELYGADFSWTEDLRVNEKNEICRIDNHFYEKGEKLEYKPIKAKVTIDQYFLTKSKMFYSCREIQDYAKVMGCDIINMNPSSYIDAFRKI